MVQFLLFLSLLITGCGRPAPTPHAPPPRAEAPDLDYPVGTFSLTERSGKTVTDADLKGKVWVASFVFTRCTAGCPQVAATVARLQTEFAAEPDVRLVTFTVDPARDDKAELQKYATHFHADPARWLFLTGDEKAVHTLLEQQFKQGVGERPGPGVKAGTEFAQHSTKLAVVDRKGVVRGIYDGIRGDSPPDADAGYADERYADAYRRLTAKVKALLREP